MTRKDNEHRPAIYSQTRSKRQAENLVQSALRVPNPGDSIERISDLTESWIAHINKVSDMGILKRITLTLGEVDDPDSLPFLHAVNDAIQKVGQSINTKLSSDMLIPNLSQNIKEAEDAARNSPKIKK